MVALPPIIEQALADADLTKRDIRVFLAATNHLDFQEYRPLKLATLELELKMDMAPISRSLQRLTDAGYLRRRVRARANQYRLRFSLGRLPDRQPSPAA